MKQLLLLLSIVILTFPSCKSKYLSTPQKISTIKKLEPMLGTWVTYSTVYTNVEIWKKVNDTTMSGRSIMIMSGDTVLNETMCIQPGPHSIYLTSKNLLVADSDIESYQLTKLKADKIIFEKAISGKPDKITYIFITPETMRILIQAEGKSIESYNMKKIIKK